MVRNHGLPRTILSDQDPRYMAKVWNELWKICGTSLYFTPTYHPISNSANERSHQVIKDMLRSFTSSEIDKWDDNIPAIEFAMNNQENIDTGKTPFILDTGQHPLDPVSLQTPQLDNKHIVENWKTTVAAAVQSYIEAQELRLKRINRNQVYPPFKAGDDVMLQ